LPRRRVLVVDDNVDAAATLAQLVALLGHDAALAFDGLQALEMARTTAPEIVLLDLGMPHLDGIETAKRLRAAPGGSDLYIAAVTGWGQESDRERTRAAGFDLHLVKPIDIDALTQLLARPRRA
jgi:CheY-like chemotaxis protein